jgi:6-phosphogluconate dehydrogenase
MQGGCIIRAGFLDRIKQAYQRDPNLPSLLVDPPFAKVRHECVLLHAARQLHA